MCKNELFSSSISFQNIKKTTIEPDRKQSSDIREGTYLSWVQLANGIMTLPSLIDLSSNDQTVKSKQCTLA